MKNKKEMMKVIKNKKTQRYITMIDHYICNMLFNIYCSNNPAFEYKKGRYVCKQSVYNGIINNNIPIKLIRYIEFVKKLSEYNHDLQTQLAIDHDLNYFINTLIDKINITFDEERMESNE